MPSNSIRGGKTGKKERFYLLFVGPVSCITDTPFSAVSTVIVVREKCKPFLLCLAGDKEKGWETCCQLDASFLQWWGYKLVYRTQQITLFPKLSLT